MRIAFAKVEKAISADRLDGWWPANLSRSHQAPTSCGMCVPRHQISALWELQVQKMKIFVDDECRTVRKCRNEAETRQVSPSSGKHVHWKACGRLTWVACNFTHRWTANENFSACGAGEPAAQARKLFGGKRAKKRALVLSTKAEKSREELRSSILT